MAKADSHILTREELNRKLWGAADILRGVADAGDYKNHILGLMFLKRLSDVFDERYEEIIDEWIAQGRSRKEAKEIAKDPDEYGEGAFFIPEGARWSDLMGIGENRAEAIDIALHKIEEQNARYLENVLTGVRFNDERRFGDPVEMDGLMQRLLTHFSKIPLGDWNLAEIDVLGDAYEYMLERFAESAGKKGGEFLTPAPVVRLIAQCLKPQEGMRIHDPTGGSGRMLIEAGNYVVNHGGNRRNLTLTAQEKNIGTLAMMKMNMLLHNVPDADCRGGDTIRNPRFVEGGRLMRFDRVMANPPFSLKDWGHEVFDPDKKSDTGRPHDSYNRFHRGIPPRTKGDMAFLQHMVEVANDTGMVGVVMPHGVLFRGGAEAKIRRAMLDEDLFEAVIGLPEALFFGTGIPASILILNRNKPEERQGKVLFIDASPEGFYLKGSARNYLRNVDVMRIVAVFNAFAQPGEVTGTIDGLKDEFIAAVELHRDRQLSKAKNGDPTLAERVNEEADGKIKSVQEDAGSIHGWLNKKYPSGRTSLEKFAAVVPLKEIAEENDFNLNISRYVDSTEPPPQLDVAEELAKLRELEKARDKAESEMNELLKELGYA